MEEIEINPLEKRAQEIILEAGKQIIKYQDAKKEIDEDIKDIKNDVKAEGINVKALNGAIKRYRAHLNGKVDLENDLDEADIYLEVLKENLL